MRGCHGICDLCTELECFRETKTAAADHFFEGLTGDVLHCDVVDTIGLRHVVDVNDARNG